MVGNQVAAVVLSSSTRAYSQARFGVSVVSSRCLGAPTAGQGTHCPTN